MNAPANPAATVTALIADDEPLLAQALQAELAAVWPALHVRAVAANGRQALEQLVASPVDIAFLDIRMPGLTGLEVGQRIAATWADSAPARALVPAPLIVFVTAYGEFALEAFESAAVDYLIKPVTRARLQACVARLVQRLDERRAASQGAQLQSLAELGERLRALAGPQAAPAPPAYLSVIRAGVGDLVRMIPVPQVVLLEAADKYVLVHTDDGEALIRESLRELRDRLDPARFVQIHRSAIVNLEAVEVARRDDHGKTVLELRGVEVRPVVSRQFAAMFKAM